MECGRAVSQQLVPVCVGTIFAEVNPGDKLYAVKIVKDGATREDSR